MRIKRVNNPGLKHLGFHGRLFMTTQKPMHGHTMTLCVGNYG